MNGVVLRMSLKSFLIVQINLINLPAVATVFISAVRKTPPEAFLKEIVLFLMLLIMFNHLTNAQFVVAAHKEAAKDGGK